MLYYRHANGYVHGYIVLKKIKMWSAQNTAFDHIFDHLQTRTTWKLCQQEHTKAPFLDTKDPKITRNYTKNLCICVRDAGFERSMQCLTKKRGKPWNKKDSGLFYFFPKLLELSYFFHFDHMFWPLIKTYMPRLIFTLKSKSPFFVYCLSKFA